MNAYLKIAVTVLISFVLVCLFSFVIERGQKEYHVHKFGRMQDIFRDTTRYDVLFLGSSRTHGGIYPKIIDSVTGLKTYNGGVEGGNIYEFKLVLDGYLEHHPSPRLVIINIDPMSFDLDRKMFFPFQYFESLENNTVRHAFEKDVDYRLFFIRNFPVMRVIYYDDYSKSLALRGIMGHNELQLEGAIENKGFMSPGSGTLDTMAKKPFANSRLEIHKDGIDRLLAMVDTCRKRGIDIVFGYAPEYDYSWQQSFSNFTDFTKTIGIITDRYRIPYFRDDSLVMCQDPHLFVGYGHVNTQGAIEYSKILSKRIDSLMNKNYGKH